MQILAKINKDLNTIKLVSKNYGFLSYIFHVIYNLFYIQDIFMNFKLHNNVPFLLFVYSKLYCMFKIEFLTDIKILFFNLCT